MGPTILLMFGVSRCVVQANRYYLLLVSLPGFAKKGDFSLFLLKSYFYTYLETSTNPVGSENSEILLIDDFHRSGVFYPRQS